MKKIFFISILIITGILSPVLKVEAQIPEGAKGQYCIYSINGRSGLDNFPCEQPPAGAIGKSCTVIGDYEGPAITFTCQYPPATVLGNCTYPDTGQVTKNVAKSNCLSPGKWSVATTTQTTTDPTTQPYTLLAPLPGLEEPIDIKGEDALGKYLNVVIRLFIGFAAVLAMVMIVMGGIQYMTSELAHSKEAGKQRIYNAILGLLIALGSYLILFTLNPDLLKTNVKIDPTVIEFVGGPDSGDDTVDPDVSRGIRTYASGSSVSPGVASAVAKLKAGWQIDHFRVYNNNRMLITLRKGSEVDSTNIIDITPGLNGYSAVGAGRTGDKKTPSGAWRIMDIRYTPNQAQFSKTRSNMGAAFWHLTPTTSGERGIGMHGNKSGTLGFTNGCIRMKNADILELQPYVRVGIPVYINM